MTTPIMFEAVLVLAVLFSATMPWAAVCTVPSTPHPTIQDAVDDLICTEVVLTAQTFVEAVAIDRSLELRGASHVRVSGISLSGAERAGIRHPARPGAGPPAGR